MNRKRVSTRHDGARHSSTWGAVVIAGVPCWRACGRLYFEVEVVEAEGYVVLGFVGSNFNSEFCGKDDKSWAIYNGGQTFHR